MKLAKPAFGKVRCVDCGFLTRKWRHHGVSSITSGTATVGLNDRATLRGGGTLGELGQLTCHFGVADHSQAARGHCEQPYAEEDSWGHAPMTVEYEQAIVAETTTRRSCSRFFPYRAGYDAEGHRDLKQGVEKTRGDRTWDVAKVAVGAVLGAIAKSWYDQLRALAP